jgi:NADPH2:quinone reductase
VQAEAAGISFADLLVMQGVHPERRKPPFVPGWDVVGEVESVGSGVDHVSVGDRVGGLSIVGGWAEHAVVPGLRVVGVPRSVEATAAVCLVMDYIVAYQMLTRSLVSWPETRSWSRASAVGSERR